MKTVFVFQKCLKQQLRDRIGLALTILTAPFFVLLYYLFLGDQPKQYAVPILYRMPPGQSSAASDQTRRELSNLLKELSLSHEKSRLRLESVESQASLEKQVRSGRTPVGLIVSVDTDAPGLPQATLTVVGNASQPAYHRVAASLRKAVDDYLRQRLGFSRPINVEEKPLGLSDTRSSFDLYVPGLLVFAVIMLVFSSSMAIAREVETGTLERLKMTRVRSFDIMTGISGVQLILGLASVVITFLTARLLGFQYAGSIGLVFLLAGLTCLASVGIGMVVASLSRSTHLAFLISSVAMFLLILFSGVVFPRPEIFLFELGGHSVNLFDILPTTHMRNGLEKILTFDASFRELAYELIALLSFSTIYFATGVLIFNRTIRTFSNTQIPNA
ncbi:MAG: ABC transporter permease [Proteobacteria bacterium]|nr:ABC transporter permease [Pseudomonadota bacterium]